MTRQTANRYWVTVTIAGIVLCGAGWGCGPGGPKVGSVSGKVTLDGQPLADVLVTFMPEKGRSSTGRTDQAGKYSLSYTLDRQGAEVGKHIVRITTAAPGNAETSIVQEKLPARYHSSTELRAEVKPGRNAVDFELTSQGSPGKPSQTPARRAAALPTS